MNEPCASVGIEYYSEVEATQVEWLWYPYIPYGKLTIIQGDPGEGKTTLALFIASVQANGGVLPFTDKEVFPSVVVYQNTEDSVSDTIKPRLLRYGANCKNICYIKEDVKPLNLEDDRIEETIIQTGARLFILDPIQAFLGSSDMQRANDIRPLMKKLAQTAERTKCAIIMVGHLNKRDGGKDIYRSLGSIDIVAATRSVLLVSKDEHSNGRRMSHIKSNLAEQGQDLYFCIGEEGAKDWSLRKEILQQSEEKELPMCKKAEALIRKLLSSGSVPAKEAREYLLSNGIGEYTIVRARRKAEVKVFKLNNVWYWELNGASDK